MNRGFEKTINAIIIALALISMILGTAGWYVYFQQLGHEVDIWAALFYGLQLFTLNSVFEDIHLPLALNIARFTAPASVAGAIISGVLLLTRNGLSYLRIRLMFRKHLIICGYTRRARILIKDLVKNHKDMRIVVIDEHFEHAEEIHGKRLIFLAGNPASAYMLRRAGLNKAAYVMLLDDDQNDLRNLDQLRKMSFHGKVILHLTEPHITALYKEMSRQLGLTDLHVISDAGILANRIVDQYSPDQYVHIKSPEDPQVHVLFCGNDPMLFHLIREAGIMYQFANLKKPRFTIAVPDINAFRNEISRQIPNLAQAVDYSIIELRELFNHDQNGKTVTGIDLSMVCNGDFSYSVEIGRRLRQSFIRQNGSFTKPEILLIESLAENQYVVSDEILEKVNRLYLSYCNSLRHFSTQTVIHDIEKYDTIAKYIHSSFSIREDSDYTNAETMWEGLSDAERDWNRWPARHFHIKLRVIGAIIVPEDKQGVPFDLSTVSDEKRILLAQMEKNRWNAEKWLTGFMPGQYKEDKKLEKFLKSELKVHPALKSWEEISEKERIKDTYAFNNIDEILHKAGLKIIAEVTDSEKTSH